MEAPRKMPTTIHYKEVFSLFDICNNGLITKDTLASVLSLFGCYPTQMELLDLLNEVDINQNGIFDFNDFCNIMSRKTSKFDDFLELHEAFVIFDREQRGYITTSDVRSVMNALGEHLTEEDLCQLMEALKQDGDGKVSYENFARIMLNT
eukprot:375517_1